jgi:hypothetical protein
MPLTNVETAQIGSQTELSLYETIHAFLAECVDKANQSEFFGAHGDNACRYIVDDGNEERLAATLQDCANGIVEGRCYELPLNGAGLKLNSKLTGTGDCPKLLMYVGGDQANLYPQFVAWANEELFQLGLCREWHRPKAS